MPCGLGAPVLSLLVDVSMTSNGTDGTLRRPPFPSLYDPSREANGDWAFENGYVLVESEGELCVYRGSVLHLWSSHILES